MGYNIESKIFKSTIWKLLECGGIQGASFVVQIILARILLPEDFGEYTIVLTFVALGTIIVDCGFGVALIQKKEVDDVDVNTTFTISLCLSIAIYVALFFIAPTISSFYEMPNIKEPIRIIGVSLIIGSFKTVEVSLASRKLKFKMLFCVNFCIAIGSAIVGIVLACRGFGVWALVFQYIINIVGVSIVLIPIVKWLPRLKINFKKAKLIFFFGWKLLVASLLNRLYIEIYNLVIGKFISSAGLGIYSRGKLFPFSIQGIVSSAIESVMLSFYSKEQDNVEKLYSMLRHTIRIIAFVIFPVMFGLAAVAEPLTIILLTEKWVEIVPIIQIFAFGYAFAPISAANLMAINAIGRSGIYLKLEIVKRVIGLTLLFLTMRHGIIAISLGLSVSIVINTIINIIPNNKLFGYDIKEQLKDVIPSFFLSVLMFIVIYFINYIIDWPNYIVLIADIAFGVLLYVGLAHILNVKGYADLLHIIKNKEKKG